MDSVGAVVVVVVVLVVVVEVVVVVVVVAGAAINTDVEVAEVEPTSDVRVSITRRYPLTAMS